MLTRGPTADSTASAALDGDKATASRSEAMRVENVIGRPLFAESRIVAESSGFVIIVAHFDINIIAGAQRSRRPRFEAVVAALLAGSHLADFARNLF